MRRVPFQERLTWTKKEQQSGSRPLSSHIAHQRRSRTSQRSRSISENAPLQSNSGFPIDLQEGAHLRKCSRSIADNAPLLSIWGFPVELSLTSKRIVHLCVCECEDVYLRHSLEKGLSTRGGGWGLRGKKLSKLSQEASRQARRENTNCSL
jgi:hypothetical protein